VSDKLRDRRCGCGPGGRAAEILFREEKSTAQKPWTHHVLKTSKKTFGR